MSDKKRENIFEIMDNIMLQLSKTKRLFLIMILTVLILPPISMLVMVNVFDSPFERRFERQAELREQLGLPPDNLSPEQRQLLMDEMHQGKPPFKHPQLVIVIISLVWLGIGIRQWFVLSKWSKKYHKFKAQQDEVDKQLDDNSD